MKIKHEPGFLSKTIPRSDGKLDQSVLISQYNRLKEQRWRRLPWYLKAYYNTRILIASANAIAYLYFPNIYLYFLNMVHAVQLHGELIFIMLLPILGDL